MWVECFKTGGSKERVVCKSCVIIIGVFGHGVRLRQTNRPVSLALRWLPSLRATACKMRSSRTLCHRCLGPWSWFSSSVPPPHRYTNTTSAVETPKTAKTLDYFEPQAYGTYEGVIESSRKNLCALHATNNLVGCRLFTLDEFRAFDRRLNDFTTDVFLSAFEKHLKFRCFLSRGPLDATSFGLLVDAFLSTGNDFAGVVVHRPGHYVAFQRCVNSNFLCIDSLGEQCLDPSAEITSSEFKSSLACSHSDGHEVAFIGYRSNSYPWNQWETHIQPRLKRKRAEETALYRSGKKKRQSRGS